MSTLLTRMFSRPRAFCSHRALCQLGHGRACACDEKRRRLPVRKIGIRTGPASFWWAYALLLLASAAVWRACS